MKKLKVTCVGVDGEVSVDAGVELIMKDGMRIVNVPHDWPEHDRPDWPFLVNVDDYCAVTVQWRDEHDWLVVHCEDEYRYVSCTHQHHPPCFTTHYAAVLVSRMTGLAVCPLSVCPVPCRLLTWKQKGVEKQILA